MVPTAFDSIKLPLPSLSIRVAVSSARSSIRLAGQIHPVPVFEPFREFFVIAPDIYVAVYRVDPAITAWPGVAKFSEARADSLRGSTEYNLAKPNNSLSLLVQ